METVRAAPAFSARTAATSNINPGNIPGSLCSREHRLLYDLAYHKRNDARPIAFLPFERACHSSFTDGSL